MTTEEKDDDSSCDYFNYFQLSAQNPCADAFKCRRAIAIKANKVPGKFINRHLAYADRRNNVFIGG